MKVDIYNIHMLKNLHLPNLSFIFLYLDFGSGYSSQITTLTKKYPLYIPFPLCFQVDPIEMENLH